MSLKDVIYGYPTIDNHAHPLCKAEHRSEFPLEGILSEAQGSALTEDSIHTVAFYRGSRQLANLYGLDEDSSWDDIKAARETIAYDRLCDISMQPTRIQCLLLDDGLGGMSELCYPASWHDRFTSSPTKRIVRVEVVAQEILKDLFEANRNSSEDPAELFSRFSTQFESSISASAADSSVAGFKSVACYRTGLNISTSSAASEQAEIACLSSIIDRHRNGIEIRINDKAFNDFVVRKSLEIAGKYKKPVQFHTGLGDSDITLALASPAHMQSIIKAYPETVFVLLHSSYPYTRDAAYLTSVYPNVYLDFGEIFPMLSPEGQRGVMRQILELCPTNKIMWSTDGHWWPESFYLGAIQARQIIYEVLFEHVQRGDLSEAQACLIGKRALFHTANRVYGLNLKPVDK